MSQIKKNVRKIIGSKYYINIKNRYKGVWKKLHKKLTFDEFSVILKKNLNIKLGSIVFVHSSVSEMNIDFPFFQIIPLLKKIVGEEGTIVFPTHQVNNKLEEYLDNPDAIFDVEKTPTVLGLLPEIMRRDKNSIRSLHPTHSVTAYGNLATEIVEDHINSVYPCGEKSPLYKIAENKGIVIGLGVDTRYLTFVHTIEDIMKDEFPVSPISRKIYNCKVKDSNGNILNVKTLMNYKKNIPPKIPKFMKRHISKEICCDFKIKGNKFYYCDTSALMDKMKELARKNITIYEIN